MIDQEDYIKGHQQYCGIYRPVWEWIIIHRALLAYSRDCDNHPIDRAVCGQWAHLVDEAMKKGHSDK